jgi:leucyl aminopeptidase (aminopeptidase T)
MTIRGQKISNLTLKFEDGLIVDIQADKNADLVERLLETSNEQSGVLSIIDLGINPDSHPLEGSDFYSWEMNGLVTLATGSNTWAGGDLISDSGLTLHIANSDLTVNGTQLIKEGVLLIDQQAEYR